MRSALVLSCLLALVSTSLAGQAKPSPGLDGRLRAIVAARHGDVAVYAEDLPTHRKVEISADRIVQTASVIKLAVLY